MSVRERVLQVIARVAENVEVISNPQIHLYQTGLLDSFATVELMVQLEEEFGIPFSPADFDPEAWATPEKIVAIVESRV
ncbi:MAG: D-alanine--poly(phosphoribitol) ligase subunit DltC [Mycobacterium leprae]